MKKLITIILTLAIISPVSAMQKEDYTKDLFLAIMADDPEFCR